MIPTKETVEPDDRQLVETIRGGDADAFEMLVRRKTSKVYSLCYRIIGNSEDAKDISQLVFIKLWENLEKYDAQYAFDTWLYRMVTNVAIDFMRNKQSRENAVNSNLRLVKTSSDAEQGTIVQRKEVESVFNTVSQVLWSSLHGVVALLITLPRDLWPVAPAAADLVDQTIENGIRGFLAEKASRG